MHSGDCRRAAGFAYLTALFALAALGLTAAGAGLVWHTVAQREKEAELLFIGNQYRSAIGRYYEASPGAKLYPKHLEDLVEDKRFPQPRRHLRKRFPDPVTNSHDWGLVLEQERILGVYSKSDATPLKTGNFSEADADFEGREQYSQWRFVYRPNASSPAAPAAAAAPSLAAPLLPTTEERLQMQTLEPDAQRAACAAGHVAELRRCASLPMEQASPCYVAAARKRDACQSGFAATIAR